MLPESVCFCCSGKGRKRVIFNYLLFFNGGHFLRIPGVRVNLSWQEICSIFLVLNYPIKTWVYMTSFYLIILVTCTEINCVNCKHAFHRVEM